MRSPFHLPHVALGKRALDFVDADAIERRNTR
jgi:hypothetical protein